MILDAGMRQIRPFFSQVLASIPRKFYANFERSWFGFCNFYHESDYLKIFQYAIFPMQSGEIKNWSDVGYIPLYCDQGAGFLERKTQGIVKELKS